jgi:hypothetical protein
VKSIYFVLWAALFPASVLAQAPAAPAGPAAPTGTIDQDKGAGAVQQPAGRSSSSRPGFTPPPMNIRIRDEGIKMPKCTAESREGEACKK